MTEADAVLFSFAIAISLAACIFGAKRRAPEDINGCHAAIQQLARENYLLSSQVEWMRKNGKR